MTITINMIGSIPGWGNSCHFPLLHRIQKRKWSDSHVAIDVVVDGARDAHEVPGVGFELVTRAVQDVAVLLALQQVLEIGNGR